MADAAGSQPLRTPHELLAALRTQSAGSHVRVALDAMGGDLAPAETVRGALAVAGEQLSVVLVGRRAELEPLVAGAAHVEIVPAADVISSSEEPAKAVRGRPEASIVVAARLVAGGQADALVSAGSTGAVLAASLLYIRRLKGVSRPAICTLMPSIPLPIVFLDMGANADVRPEHLRQFAVMGQAFATEVLGLERPTVGLLSIGEEPAKGNQLVVEAHRLIAGDEQINFYGNVEGRDLMNRKVDIVVADGFTGNVAVKVTEGTARAILGAIKGAVTGSVRAKLGAALMKPDLRRIRDALDPEEYGGAYLLGMNRPVVIAHGNSRARGIGNAVLAAARAVTSDLLPTIAARLGADGADEPPDGTV